MAMVRSKQVDFDDSLDFACVKQMAHIDFINRDIMITFFFKIGCLYML